MTEEELRDWLINRIEDEQINFKEASKLAGINCPGANQAIGALDAYREVLEILDT